MRTNKFTLRPNVSGQHERYISGAVFIDVYLYSTGAVMYALIETRLKGQNVLPDMQVLYALKPDMFGLFVELRLYASPNAMGAPVTVDNLKALTSVQRIQLRRLLVLLSMQHRAALQTSGKGSRYSTKIHPLTPVPCDPLEGVANHYATSGRAARDAELARRVQENG